MLSIRTNMSALIAHRNFGLHQQTMQKALQRLSSGYRINSAADDAAGLAISEKMRGQIRGLKMASQNAQQSISMLQTAEGGLNETHAILQRMRELAVQAENGTYSNDDRANLNLEYQALKSEIDRIADTTHYNGLKLLNGSSGGKQGADALGRVGVTGGISVTGNLTGDGKLLLQKLESGDFQLVLQVGDETKVQTLSSSGANNVSFTFSNGATTVTFNALNKANLKEGVITDIRFNGTASPDLSSAITANTDDHTIFQIGANGGADQRMNSRIEDMSTGSLGDKENGNLLKDTDILNPENAKKALELVDKAVKQVSYQRAGIGASINRLGHTINNLENSIENLTAAESTIRDADMAEEMMNYTKANILMQAAQAMMAQAMQQPNIILEMLKSM